MAIAEQPLLIQLGESRPIRFAAEHLGLVAVQNEHDQAGDTLALIDQVATQPDEQGRVLPEVTLQPDYSVTYQHDDGRYEVRQRIYAADGRQIGYADVGTDDKKGERFIGMINMNNGQGENEQVERGKGQGMAAYLALARQALEQGYSFTNDYNGYQLGAAKRIWEKLRDAGLAEEVEPFTGDGMFKGHYVIAPRPVRRVPGKLRVAL